MFTVSGTVHAFAAGMSTADDLQARVECFADGVLEFLPTIVLSPVTNRVIDQLGGAATSIAANYRAARRARSHAEFTAKIGVVAEEADESTYWLGLAVRHLYGDRAAAKKLSEEALELTKIFARSASTARSKHRKNPNR